MAIIDLDSHLRDGWFLDEIYKLDGPFAGETPKRVGEGALYYSKFELNLGREEELHVDVFPSGILQAILHVVPTLLPLDDLSPAAPGLWIVENRV